MTGDRGAAAETRPRVARTAGVLSTVIATTTATTATTTAAAAAAAAGSCHAGWSPVRLIDDDASAAPAERTETTRRARRSGPW